MWIQRLRRQENNLFGRGGVAVQRSIYLRAALIIAVAVGVVVGLAGCARSAESTTDLDFVLETESRLYDEAPLSDERVRELRQDVQRRRQTIAQLVQEYGQTAAFERQLAEALLQRNMYEPALEALQRAMAIQGENAVLYYWAGVAAARSAAAHELSGSADEFLQLSRRMYERAIQFRPDYFDALYGLAVLLTFELDLPGAALPHVERAVQLESGDARSNFLLGHVLVRTGRLHEAADVYARLERSAPSAQQRAQAVENRARILEELRVR